MARRLHVPALTIGTTQLDPIQSRHARDVLRLTVGTPVELFDDAGNSANAVISQIDAAAVLIRVDAVRTAKADAIAITVFAAIPKGDRADWMVEKLSEVGVTTYVPLAAARSVVLPGGKNKLERWARLATESAKQCERVGVMRIGELTTVEDALNELQAALHARISFVCSTDPAALPISVALTELSGVKGINLFVGPEGDWTNEELRRFFDAGLTAVKLTTTILRVETAAVVAAAAVAVWAAGIQSSEISVDL